MKRALLTTLTATILLTVLGVATLAVPGVARADDGDDRYDGQRKGPVPCSEVLPVGHRGAGRGPEENTLYSFRKVVRDPSWGVRAIEFDIRRLKGGKMVVFHDRNIKRITGKKKLLSDVNYKQFRKLRTKGGHRLPTAERAIEVLGRYSHGAQVHIKIDLNNRAIKKLWGWMTTAGYTAGRVEFHGENRDMLKRIREITGATTGYTFYGSAPTDEQLDAIKADGIRTAVVHHRNIDNDVSDRIQGRGLILGSWSDGLTIAEAASLGIERVALDGRQKPC